MYNIIKLEKMLKEHLEKMSRVHWTLRTEYEQDTKNMIKVIEQIKHHKKELVFQGMIDAFRGV